VDQILRLDQPAGRGRAGWARPPVGMGAEAVNRDPYCASVSLSRCAVSGGGDGGGEDVEDAGAGDFVGESTSIRCGRVVAVT
jgi:hypothetical protein